jgi:predicted restriction endonuclease
MLCPNHHRMFDSGLIPVEEIRAARMNVLIHQ